MVLVSLSIDTILPGLDQLVTDLGVATGNRLQWVITLLFLGLAVGSCFMAHCQTASDDTARSFWG